MSDAPACLKLVGLDGAIEFDEGGWPVLVVRFHAQPTDDEFEAYLARYDEIIQSAKRYSIVYVTMPTAPMIKAKHARMQAKWIKEHQDVIGRICTGVAFVLPSVVMRGALKAIMRMAPMPVDFTVLDSEAEGVRWARESLGLVPALA